MLSYLDILDLEDSSIRKKIQTRLSRVRGTLMANGKYKPLELEDGKTVTPATTGEYEFFATVTKAGKTLTKTGKVLLFSDPDTMIVQKYKGNMLALLDEINKDAIDRLKASLRQACYVVLQGPEKPIYAQARKLYRDWQKFFDLGQAPSAPDPKQCFDTAQAGYSMISGASDVKYDESKVVGEEEEEEETTE